MKCEVKEEKKLKLMSLFIEIDRGRLSYTKNNS